MAAGLRPHGNGEVDLDALRADPRQAIQEEGIVCLLCRGIFRQLTNTHLRAHRVTAAEYKALFGYNRNRLLMCRALLRLYADRAIRVGLAAFIQSRPILSEPELRRRGGMRPLALEERLTRREAQLLARERRRGVLRDPVLAPDRRRNGDGQVGLWQPSTPPPGTARAPHDPERGEQEGDQPARHWANKPVMRSPGFWDKPLSSRRTDSLNCTDGRGRS